MRLFLQNLKQALRELKKHVAQAGVSAVGIAISVVCLTFSLNWFWSETNRDYFRPDYEDLYLLRTRAADSTQKWKDYRTQISYYYQPQLDSLFRGAGVPYSFIKNDWISYRITIPDDPKARFYAQRINADTAFLRTAGVKTLAGDARQALLQPDKIVLTAKAVQEIFGCSPAKAIGRSLTSQGILPSVYFNPHSYTVGAVIDGNEDPDATNIGYDAIWPLDIDDNERQAGNLNYQVLIRTHHPEEVTQLLRRVRFHEEEDAHVYFDLTPLRTSHNLGTGKSIFSTCFYPIAFCCLSFILLLSALVNLTATYTSIFLSRSREYALRRSLGATRRQNAAWMLTETAPVLLIGLLLAALGLEWSDRLDSVPGIRSHSYTALAQVSLATVLLYLVGMTYPVWKMQAVYRASFGQGGGRKSSSHTWLLAVQCFACALLLFVSIGMQRQLSGMIHQDLGYERENILRLHTGRENLTDKVEPFSYIVLFDILPSEFRKESASGITDAIAMRADIFNSFSRRRMRLYTAEEKENGLDKQDEANESRNMVERMMTPISNEQRRIVSVIEVPYRAIDFFHIRVEGAPTPVWSERTEQEGMVQVVLNQAAAQLLKIGNKGEHREQVPAYYPVNDGFDNVLLFNSNDHISDKQLNIRGVAAMRLTDFHEPEEPLMMVGIPEGKHACNVVEYDAVYVKHAPGRRAEAEAAMRRVLKKHDVPDDDILIEPLDQYIADSYKEEAYYSRLLNALTVFSLIVTLSGVASMLLYSLRLRRRSLAIRRLMGADFRTIFRQNARTYMVVTLIGCAVAFLPGYILMSKWMEYFHYGSTPGLGLMALIATGMLILVEIIVFFQVRKAMREKPVEVLRPES